MIRILTAVVMAALLIGAVPVPVPRPSPPPPAQTAIQAPPKREPASHNSPPDTQIIPQSVSLNAARDGGATHTTTAEDHFANNTRPPRDFFDYAALLLPFLVGLATVLVLLLQLHLFGRTLTATESNTSATRRNAIAALATAKASKRSADIAERALTELEAPAVFVEFFDVGLRRLPIGPIQEGKWRYSPGLIKYCFVNYGRTPARIIWQKDVLKPMPKGGGAPTPIEVEKEVYVEMPWGAVIPPNGGKSEVYAYKVLPHLLGEDQGRFFETAADTAMFFSIAVRYEDILENRYIVGSCYMLDDQRSTWILANYGFPYSYRLREDRTHQN